VNPPVRIASVIGIPARHVAEYERLHADVWPAVLARITASRISNYSIFRYGGLLFSYLEYVGDDYEADMAAMAADPATQEWWSFTDRLQDPLEGRPPGSWLPIPEVFHWPGADPPPAHATVGA
jgi:L-rhamnose mutarotase